jgi:hypothetical protein
MIKNGIIQCLISLLLSTSFTTTAAVMPTVLKPEQAISYRNKTYHFSFIIPANWEKQSGQVSADNVLFMQLPIENSCSFQFNVIQMPATFPAEAAVNSAIAIAYHELKLNKLLSVKRRDTLLKEKFKEKGKEKEKVIVLTRGWEITEKARAQKQQHIIYQVYDRQNRYFNFVAMAASEKFVSCAAELRKIIDSISFSPL